MNSNKFEYQRNRVTYLLHVQAFILQTDLKATL